MNRVLFLRTTSIVDDSRVRKEMDALLKAGFQVGVYGWDRSRKSPLHQFHLENGNVNLDYSCIHCSYGGGLKNIIKRIMFNAQLKKYLKKNKNNYDIIHSCDLDTGIIARKFCKKYHKKLVYDIFDYFIDCHSLPLFLKDYFEKQEIKVINDADMTIICTEQRKAQIKKAHPKRLIVIHNTPKVPINLEKIDFKIKGKTKNFKIVYVGVLQNGRLLKEVAEQLKENPAIELHIGGFGIYENYFKQMSQDYKNIYFYGSMDYTNVLKLESQANALFATYDPNILNHKYSAPNKVYEAMALGKPIIVCKDTGVDKIVADNKIGEVISYSGLDFEKAIYEIKRQKYNKEKIQKVYSLYHWNTMENRLINGYKEL